MTDLTSTSRKAVWELNVEKARIFGVTALAAIGIAAGLDLTRERLRLRVDGLTIARVQATGSLWIARNNLSPDDALALARWILDAFGDDGAASSAR